MNNLEIGAKKVYSFEVKKEDIAAFKGSVVHQVCSTFVLAREIEWCTRLFVIDGKLEDEEGIGTKLEIEHKGPAFVGEIVDIHAAIISFENGELICNYAAQVKDRLVATGVTGQKLLKKDKIRQIFSTFK